MFLIQVYREADTGLYWAEVEDRGGVIHATRACRDPEEAEARAGEWIVAYDERMVNVKGGAA